MYESCEQRRFTVGLRYGLNHFLSNLTFAVVRARAGNYLKLMIVCFVQGESLLPDYCPWPVLTVDDGNRDVPLQWSIESKPIFACNDEQCCAE